MSIAWRSHSFLDPAFDRALTKEDKRDLRLRHLVRRSRVEWYVPRRRRTTRPSWWPTRAITPATG